MLTKFTIAYKDGLEFYYSFDSYQYEISDRGAIIDSDFAADAIARRHGFTDNGSHPTSPFIPPVFSLKSKLTPV